MPLYFDCGPKAKETGYTIYMGKDKYENEELIRWGWPEDIWFHVDDLSSAHVYLRQPEVGFLGSFPRSLVYLRATFRAVRLKTSRKRLYIPAANLSR
jgi:hypothetical protein